MNPSQSAEKVWFITGASRGFGRVWAIAALERGDKVAVSARDISSLQPLVAKYAGAVLPLRLDVTDREAVLQAVTTVNERHNAIDAQRARMETVQPAFEPIPVQPEVPRVIVQTNADDEISKTIRITGSQRKIDALLKFLEEGWYKYEVEA